MTTPKDDTDAYSMPTRVEVMSVARVTLDHFTNTNRITLLCPSGEMTLSYVSEEVSEHCRAKRRFVRVTIEEITPQQAAEEPR